jgi:hypothetical protein
MLLVDSHCRQSLSLYPSDVYNFCSVVPFGPKRDEVTGEWRKLRSEKLHILYSSPNIIRNQGELGGGGGGRDMWHAWERRGMCTRF